MKPGSHKEGHYILAPPFEVDQVLRDVWRNKSDESCHLRRG